MFDWAFLQRSRPGRLDRARGGRSRKRIELVDRPDDLIVSAGVDVEPRQLDDQFTSVRKAEESLHTQKFGPVRWPSEGRRDGLAQLPDGLVERLDRYGKVGR